MFEYATFSLDMIHLELAHINKCENNKFHFTLNKPYGFNENCAKKVDKNIH